jgi:GntR family transcriptional regulator/MocR family aminotransferase
MSAFVADFREGVDIDLGVGYVNEKTIPIPLLAEAMQAVAGDPVAYRQAFNYGGPHGSPNLLAAIRRFLARPGIEGLDEATLERKRMIIGPCGATSILEGLADILAPGIVVTSDPMYYIYSDALERKGFQMLAVPEDHEGIGLEPLERKLSALGNRAEEISFFYVVTVNNPSCTILSNSRRRALYEIAARVSREQNRAIPIVFDLAYELLLHDPATARFESVLPLDDLDIAYEIGTLSKILAPSLRIGYLLGPPGPLMEAMTQKTSDAGFSAPVFVQEMAGYMIDRHVDEQLRAVNAGYRRKALAVRAAIERELGEFLSEYRGGSAGFYFYLTFRDIETQPGSLFFRILSRTTGEPEIDGPPEARLPRVSYIPGTYCVHPRGDLAAAGRRQLRLSYAFEDESRILDALKLMRKAAQTVADRQMAAR